MDTGAGTGERLYFRLHASLKLPGSYRGYVTLQGGRRAAPVGWAVSRQASKQAH